MKQIELLELLEYIPFVRMFIRKPAFAFLGASSVSTANDATGRLCKKPKNKLLSILIESLSIVVLYFALSPLFAMPLYNSLIFHPMPLTGELSQQITGIAQFFHCHFQEANFNAPDGEKLHGWLFQKPGSKYTIMVSHGNAGNIEHRLALCPLLLQTGASVFLYDYEGFGKSTGSPTVPNICDDAVAAFDYLTKVQHVKASNIVLYGESIGAGVTSELSTKRTAGGIILQSGFTSLADAGADRILFFKLYPSWMYTVPHLSNIDIMHRQHAPLLIIHGKKDDILSYHYSERIMREASQPKMIALLPDANHSDIYQTNVNVTAPALKKFFATLP